MVVILIALGGFLVGGLAIAISQASIGEGFSKGEEKDSE
jgi:hypothetical protein